MLPEVGDVVDDLGILPLGLEKLSLLLLQLLFDLLDLDRGESTLLLTYRSSFL